MGDDDRRAIREQRVDGAFDVPFRGRIQAGGCLVEHDEPRIAEENPREREQLCLARREAARAHLGTEGISRGLRPEPGPEPDALDDVGDPRVLDRRVEEGQVVAH